LHCDTAGLRRRARADRSRATLARLSYASKHSLGLTYALLSALSNAVYLLAMRQATQQTDVGQVVLGLLIFAALFNTASFAIQVVRNGVPARSAAEGLFSRASILLSLFTVAGNFAAGRAIALLHPAVASVLIQLQVLFAAAAAWWFLTERVSWAFAFGSIVSLGGIGVMQWRDGAIGNDVGQGTAWALGAALAFGLMQVITRSVAARVDPLRFNAERLWLSVLWMSLLPGQLSGLLAASSSTLWLAAVAACFGPFLGRVALIYAARHLSAALATLLGLLSPVVVLALSIPLFGQLPRPLDLAGGALAIAGTLIALRAPRSQTA
jgi:drug/metabolite transporter (DMT)-like permease